MSDPHPNLRSPPPRLSRARVLLFALVVWVGCLLAIEGTLASFGIEPLGLRVDPYVGFASRIPLYVRATAGDGRPIFETARNKLAFFNDQHFDAVKLPGTRRLFCIGGSTTYGHPFDDSTSFCGWLRELLAQSDASQRWEVVNAGGISYASYRAAAVMEEITAHAPDVFVIYTGQNEFLERRTYANVLETPAWLLDADVLLRRTRSYSELRRALDGLRSLSRATERAQLSGEVEAILDRSVGPDAYRRDDALREKVLAHYRFNLERMVEIARAAGAEPVFVTPASNLRDCSPFASEHSPELSPAARERWRDHFEAGRRALAEDRAGAARENLAQAVGLDPRRADGQYWLARALAAAGDADAAARAFERARDEDICPLRALSAMPGIVRSVAREQDAAVVDFGRLLRETAGRSDDFDVFGDEFFLDHVHPTIEANGRLAQAILAALRERKIVAAPAPSPQDVAAVRTRILAGVDERKQGESLRNVAKVMSWGGKTEDAARAARHALERLGDDAECRFILGSAAAERGHWDEAIDQYRAALRLEPGYTKVRNNLGIALTRTGRLEEAVAEYRRTLAAEPAHQNARFNLANALARLGRLDEAIANYAEVLRENPGDVDAHYNLARAYARRGDLAPAAEHYRSLLELDPDDALAQRALAEIDAQS